MMNHMPKIGQIYVAPKLYNALLLCIGVRKSMYGTHYDFFVLDSEDSKGSQFRSWMESDCDIFYSSGDLVTHFGMRYAMKQFAFTCLT